MGIPKMPGHRPDSECGRLEQPPWQMLDQRVELPIHFAARVYSGSEQQRLFDLVAKGEKQGETGFPLEAVLNNPLGSKLPKVWHHQKRVH